MEKENLSPARGAVQLVRRKLVKDYVDALTPQNVTNSGKSDGGWMDSMGVTAAGLGHMLTETPDPIDMCELARTTLCISKKCLIRSSDMLNLRSSPYSY